MQVEAQRSHLVEYEFCLICLHGKSLVSPFSSALEKNKIKNSIFYSFQMEY